MSSGSDFSPTGPPPYGGAVGLDGGLPPADARPPADDPLGQEFVRPSAIARDAVTFPTELPAHPIDAAEVVDRVTAHLAVPGEP